MTKLEAIEKAESRWWEGLSHKVIAQTQMNEARLIMPFELFHESVEKTLGRPVFTHEFASELLKEELNQ